MRITRPRHCGQYEKKMKKTETKIIRDLDAISDGYKRRDLVGGSGKTNRTSTIMPFFESVKIVWADKRDIYYLGEGNKPIALSLSWPEFLPEADCMVLTHPEPVMARDRFGMLGPVKFVMKTT